jgi:hypothetical protein
VSAVQGGDVLQEEAQGEARVGAREPMRGAALVSSVLKRLSAHESLCEELTQVCDYPGCEERALDKCLPAVQGGDVLQQEAQGEARVGTREPVRGAVLLSADGGFDTFIKRSSAHESLCESCDVQVAR